MKHTGMDRTCSTHGRDKQCAQYLVGILEGGDQQKDVSIDGMIRLNWILKGKRSEYVDWIYLAQDRVLWRDVLKKFMKFRVPQQVGIRSEEKLSLRNSKPVSLCVLRQFGLFIEAYEIKKKSVEYLHLSSLLKISGANTTNRCKTLLRNFSMH